MGSRLLLPRMSEKCAGELTTKNTKNKSGFHVSNPSSLRIVSARDVDKSADGQLLLVRFVAGFFAGSKNNAHNAQIPNNNPAAVQASLLRLL